MLLNDKQIALLAIDGMIDPFVPGQVRETTNRGYSTKVISYGLSSAGYDIRLGRSFKVFKPVWEGLSLTDPKASQSHLFDEFEDADYCIIPPNSYLLGHSIERFKVPRNVQVLVVGKCLTGESRIVDAVSGDYVKISEFCGKATAGLENWTPIKADVNRLFHQGKRPVFKLITRMGREIRATPNHQLRTFHGWVELADLKPGDRIALPRVINVFGNDHLQPGEASLLGLMISEGQCNTPGSSPTFTTSDPVLANLCTASIESMNLGTASFNGAYGYRLVNHKKRGGKMETNKASLWLQSLNLNVGASSKFIPGIVFRAPRKQVIEFLQALFSGDGSFQTVGQSSGRIEYYSDSKRLVDEVAHLLNRFGIIAAVRSRETHGKTRWRIQITDNDQIQRFYEEIGFVPGSIKQLLLEDSISTLHQTWCAKLDTLPREAWNTLKETMERHKIIGTQPRIRKRNGIKARSISMHDAREIVNITEDSKLNELVSGVFWDEVVSIQADGEDETYDIEVLQIHNFIANGLVVHNSTYARCGLIVNVTPGEPGWEGHWTIEISNASPLPAKVYADEGIAQCLFFQIDEPEVSYADRGGKYQGQNAEVVTARL